MRYEKWSLGYWALRLYVRFVDWVIHDRTVLIGKEKIPKDKPILFAPNHQNALSDPMAILLNIKRQPVWLARADIFKNKTAAAILRFLKIMPVYRMRDGKENLLKNEETFANSIKVLENNGALALFPEGTHTGKRQMISHKKAVPRIVFMAEEKTNFALNIQIIPVGIYYSSYWKFNRKLIVNFGDPISSGEFEKEYRENPAAATVSMRNRIYESIIPLVYNIASKEHYDDFEMIVDIYGRYYLKRQNKKYSFANLFKSNKKLANELDRLEKENPDLTERIIKYAKIYSDKIKKEKIRSWLFENPKNNFGKFVLNKLILIVTLPVFVYGFLFNAIPFFIIDTINRKKVKDQTFWSSFSLALGMFLFPLFYVLEYFAVSWLIPGAWLKLAFFVSLPFAGKLAFKWYILLRKTIGRGRLVWMKLFDKNKYNEINKLLKAVYTDLDSAV